MTESERTPWAVSPPARIALVYLAMSIGWIVVTDRLVVSAGIDTPLVQTLKGSFFVLLSAGLIWYLIHRDYRSLATLRLRFDAIADQDVVGIFIARGDRLLYVNPMLARLLREPREDLLSRPASRFLNPVEEGSAPQQPGDGSSGRRVHARRDDGTTVALHVLERSTGLEDGPARIGVVLDVTPLEELEGRLRQTAKLEALGQVTGSVAHDFNNLLTGMIGQLELALLDIDGEDPLRRSLAAARDTALRAAVLTGQLLTFSRSRVSRARAIDVNAQARELRELLVSLSGATVVIRQDLEEGLPPVFLDPSSFDQVLVNLVVNANQALALAGGEITVRTRALERSGEVRVAIEVEDTGRGIPPHVLERMFEPFFTTKEHGTGLGLSTVKSIVDRGEGSLEVESEVGKGTTVRALFPPTREPLVVESKEEPPRVADLEAERTILVVDDEPAVRRVIAAALRRRGHTVLEAEDGKTARELFGREHVSLVVCDIVLPGQSGVELAQELRAARPGLKVLLITGYTPRDLVEHEASLREFAVLEKPFSVEDLTASVERLWSGADSAA